ncbi:MAG: ATP-grasp domain-containing protein [Atribacterota bacterium]
MKKILLLGGSAQQIPAIEYANKKGYYTILCDYLPDNPGQYYAKKFYCISTTDKEAILEIAKKERIDGIVAYASDPAAPTAAFVSNLLDLPGSSYESVKTLAEKDLFREFLAKNGFNYPKYISIDNPNKINNFIFENYPLYVKPVDSSGSKGVTKVEKYLDLNKAIEYALGYSRCKRVIIEENVKTKNNQLHGDGFVYDGELVFLGICDHHFKMNAPISSTYPARINKKQLSKIEKEISCLIQNIGFKYGAINVEVRISDDEKIYIMEVGPRNGGNYVPQLMKCGTGFDELAAVIETSMGNKPSFNKKVVKNYCLQYIIGSEISGKFSKLVFEKRFKEKIMEIFLHKKKGEIINFYKDSSDVVGVIIARCFDEEDLRDTIRNIKNYVKVEVLKT